MFINNYSAFTELYDDTEEMISFLTREGIKYGVYFVITATSAGAIRYRILQNFKQIYVLQMNDITDYSGILGSTNNLYPSKYEGRGIFKNENVYEFQIAYIDSEFNNSTEHIKDYCNKIRNSWGYSVAKSVPILPKKIDTNYINRGINYVDESQRTD